MLIHLLTCNLLSSTNNSQLSYRHPCDLHIQQTHPPPKLQPTLLALKPTSTILITPKPLVHPPPNLQPVLLALERTSSILTTHMPPAHQLPQLQPANLALVSTSTTLPTSMPLVHPPPKLQPAFLARINLNLYYQHLRHLIIQQSQSPPHLQPGLLALQPTSTILPNPMPLANPAILSTFSITTCYSSPRSNTKCSSTS